MRNTFSQSQTSLKKDSGLILIVVMGILLILSLLAVGLGRSVLMELSLTKYFTGQLKSQYIARAGVIYGLNQIRRDTQDERGGLFDSLYECAVKIPDDQTPAALFQHIPVGEGYFDIRYTPSGQGLGPTEEFCGFEDEERKLNMNAMTPETSPILRRLISKLGFDDTTARTIAASVVDWIDPDSEVTDQSFGAEDSYYGQLANPYYCKNFPFDSPEELLLVRGVTPEVFKQLQDLVTVFPQKTSRFLVNINTASETVLGALAENFSGPPTNTDLADAQSLTRKIIEWRSGEDGRPMTGDDRLVTMSDLKLNAREEAIFRALEKYLTPISRYIRLQVQGWDESSDATSRIEAVVNRDDLSIVSWKRD